jgi:hypothetical protein
MMTLASSLRRVGEEKQEERREDEIRLFESTACSPLHLPSDKNLVMKIEFLLAVELLR